MQRILLILIIGLLFSVPLWGQDPQSSGEPADEPETSETGEPADEPETSETGEPADEPETSETGEPEEDPLADLDEGGYGDQDEDDFVPTEEIPYDQDIPFPTDI